MPFPSNKLLFWFGMVALPASLIAALLPAFALWCYLLIFVLLFAVAVDAVLGLRNLGGLKIELPPVVRCSKERPATIEFKIGNASARARCVRIGLPLPQEIHSPAEVLDVVLPGNEPAARFAWPCTPVTRGVFALDRVYFETPSPASLWLMRSSMPTRSEIRVYPNLLAERKQLSSLFLHRGTQGLHTQRQVGKGRDFEKLREYISGDGYDEIHWKATAKRGHPVTKVFQVERTQEVYVIIDASRLSGRRVADSSRLRSPHQQESQNVAVAEEPAGDTWLERYIMSALVLGLAAEQQGDLFGLLTFTDKIERFIRAKTGKGHYDNCRDALYTLEPAIVAPDFDEVATFIRTRVRKRSLLLFLTSLDDALIADQFVRSVELICRQHLVIVNMLRPAGVEPLFSQPDTARLDDIYSHLGGHLQWQKLRELQKLLQRRGIQFSLVDNEKLTAEIVGQYLSVKQRQIL